MFKTIVIIIVVLLAALLAFAATRPDTFSVQRSTTIKAPPERIFAVLSDFHRWGAWSPYETRDPAMKRTLSGAASGKGAVYEWDGNNNDGPSPFIAKLIGIFISMDSMVGKDFETGLANLQTVAEG